MFEFGGCFFLRRNFGMLILKSEFCLTCGIMELVASWGLADGHHEFMKKKIANTLETNP